MTLTVGSMLGFSKQFEMFLMTIVALWVNIFDMAIFDLSSNIEKVWDVQMDNLVFNMETQYIIKMILSGIIFVRTFSLHIYIAFLIALFWPSLFSTRPTLMLPWLVVCAVKNLGTGVISLATGTYICLSYGPLRDSCIPFITAQIIELSPSFYMWAVGLSMYRDLKKPAKISPVAKSIDQQEFVVALRRRKVKSMINEETLKKQFESKSFQKKYLGTSAVEVKEILNTNCYENLNKNFTRSLDSLLDVLTVQAELTETDDLEAIENIDGLTLHEKIAKLLGISLSEIINIKRNKENNNNRNVIFSHPFLYQKKTMNLANNILKFESPVKLLLSTSLYSPNIKPIRSTKSELKSNKGFHNLTDPLTFSKVCDKKTHRREQKINFIALDTAETVFKKKKFAVKKEKGNLLKKCENKKENQVNKKDRSNLDFIESEVEIRTTNFITLSSHKMDTVLPISLKPLPIRPSSVKFERKPPPFCSTKMESSVITTPHIRYDAIKINKETRQTYKTMTKNEFSCQVSTLSRKVLQYSPEEMAKNLSQLSNKNKSLTVNPSNTNSNNSNNSNNKLNDTTILKNKGSKTYAAIGGYSYCNIHKEKFNNHKIPEENLCVDKFGIKSKPEFLDDGYTRMINLLSTKSKAQNKKHDIMNIQDFSL